MSELPIEIVVAIAAVLGGIAFWIRSKSTEAVIKAEAERDRVKAEAERTMADAQRIKSESDNESTRTQSQAAQTTVILDMLKQTAQNMSDLLHKSESDKQEYERRLQLEKERGEQSYQTNKRIWDDNAQMIMTTVNARADHLVTTITSQHQTLMNEIGGVPGRVDTLHEERLKVFGVTMMETMAEVLMRLEQRRQLPPTTPPFPTSNDARWSEAVITPANGHDVQVRTSPFLTDDPNVKTVWQLALTGEETRIIEEPLFHAYAIAGQDETGQFRYGWVPVSSVKVKRLEKNGAGD